MKILDKSNKKLNKQFLFTLIIAEFIIFVDYTFFYLYNPVATGSFNTFIFGLFSLFFFVLCLVSFAKLVTIKMFLFIPIGLFLMTLYISLTELFGFMDVSLSSIKLLTLSMIFLTWIFLYYTFRNEDSQKIIKYSFFVSVIFLSTSLVDFVVLKTDESKITYDKSFELLKRNKSPVEINFNSDSKLPNIIYIVPDRYAGFDQLKKYFNYDNSNFLDALEDRGFIIGKDSRSNYPSSYASMLSTLNSSYIIESSDKTKTRDYAFPAISNSYAYRNLNELGYALYNLNNHWKGTRFISNEEFNFYYEESVKSKQITLSYYINLKTPYPGIIRNLLEILTKKPSDFLSYNKKACEIQKNKLKKLSDLSQNKNNGLFVFAHILIPHPPFLLDASGDCNSFSMHDPGSDLEANKHRYIEYMKFFNTQILDIFDAMLKINKNFIFIIQSDEGPDPCVYLDPCKDNWDLKTGNINAIYASNKLKINENDLKTPINNFNYIYKYLFESDTQTLEHVVYKYRTKEEDGAFDFEEINNFEIFD